MVRAEVIRKRLNKLDEYLQVLRVQQRYTYDELASDPERYGSVERFLQLAVEVLSDLGSHVVADEGLGVVDWHSDIASVMCDHGYIDADLRDRWVRMIGFRNVLVHVYMDIDLRIVYDVLQHGLADIEALRQVFAEML
ncbi:MAG: DUF86 domain-containing protein [Anaerolineae bacterium]|jgi:uncharacterized protein YutE (UPF0331/DUF86 family)|nr:DUF86 domain-containing protein [Anaerolineae bacterium]